MTARAERDAALQERNQYRGLTEETTGLGEVGLTMATGAVAAPIAGWAGIAGSLLPGEEGQGARWNQNVQNALTYEPRTEVGQRTLGAVAGVAEHVDRFADWAGEVTGDSGDTLGATGVKTGILAIPTMLGMRTGLRPKPKQGDSLDSIAMQAQVLYESAKQQGVTATPRAVSQIADTVSQRARAAGLDLSDASRTLNQHPQARAVIDRLRREVDSGEPMSLETMMTLRQSIADVAGNSDPGVARIGRLMRDAWDEATDSLTTSDMVSRNANPQAASAMLGDARGLWRQQRNAELLDAIDARAQLAMDTPGGYQRALLAEFKKLARNEREMRRFTPEERAAIRNAATGADGAERAMRVLGMNAPRTLMGATLAAGAGGFVGAGIGAPVLGSMAAVGGLELARRSSAAALGRHRDNVSNVFRGGDPMLHGVDPMLTRSMRAGALTQSALESGEHYRGILEESAAAWAGR